MSVDNLANQYCGGKGQILGKFFRGVIDGRTLDYRVVFVERVNRFFGIFGDKRSEIIHAKIVGDVPENLRRMRFLEGDALGDFDYSFPLKNHQNDLHVTDSYSRGFSQSSEH